MRYILATIFALLVNACVETVAIKADGNATCTTAERNVCSMHVDLRGDCLDVVHFDGSLWYLCTENGGERIGPVTCAISLTSTTATIAR